MTPEQIKAAAQKELARRELQRREQAQTAQPAQEVPDQPTAPSAQAPLGMNAALELLMRAPDVARMIASQPKAAAEGAATGVDDLIRSVAEGMTFGWSDEAAAAANALMGSGTYEENLAKEQERTAEIDPTGRTIANIAGGVATGGVFGAPRSLLGAAARGVPAGALAGSGFAEPGEKMEGAATGAVTGAVLSPAMYGAANIIAPRVTQALQTMRDVGVRPTMGQIMGGGVRRAEETIKSVPLVGSMVRGAEKRALEDFNRGAVNFALRPANLTVGNKTAVGRQLIAEADDLLSSGYDDALNQITDARVDQVFQQRVAQIAQRAAQRLGRKGQRAFDNAIEDVQSLPAMSKPSFTGKEVKQAISGLRQDADRLSKNVDEDVTQAGALVRELRDELSDLMKRNTTPDNAARITGLDRAYAGFQRVREASEKGGEGFFTPFQYSQAIKRGEAQRGSREFARGQGMGQEIAEAAEKVISSRVPDSGTPERLMLPALVGGAYYVDPMAAAGVAAASAPYTRLGQNLIANLASRPSSPGQQMLAEGLRRSILPAAIAGGAATSAK